MLALLMGVIVPLSFPKTSDDVLKSFSSPLPCVGGRRGGVLHAPAATTGVCGARVDVESDPTEEPSRAFLLGEV